MRMRVLLALTGTWLCSGICSPRVAAGSESHPSQGHPFRRKIRVREGFFAIAEDLRDFPVLVRLDKRQDAVFKHAKSGAPNLLFTSEDGMTPLAHEIESVAGSTDMRELLCWVKLPLLRADEDTVFTLYYGGESPGAERSAAAVWSNRYVGVWHLAGSVADGDRKARDSSSRANHGVPTGVCAPAPGKLGSGVEFGSKGRLSSPPSSLDFARDGSFTVELWVRYKRHPTRPIRITRDLVRQFRWLDSRGHGEGWRLVFHESQRFQMCLMDDDTRGHYAWKSALDAADRWVHLATVAGREKESLTLFVNGQQAPTQPLQLPPVEARDGAGARLPIVIGADHVGCIDEVRISDVARSEDWLVAGYKNQAYPGKRITFGPEEENPSFQENTHARER